VVRTNVSKPLLLTNIGQLLTLRGGTGPRRGRELAELSIVENAAVLCAKGKIIAAGKQKDVLKAAKKLKAKEFDCGGSVVLPGFVDSHTHLIFAAPRLVDFEKRIAGSGYEEIAAAGGGIRSSVDGVRKLSRSALAKRALAALQEMSSQGTTTVEAKSGYGLNTAAEIKSLEAIREAAKQWPGTVISTLLGAHVVPMELHSTPERYLEEVTGHMIPLVAKRKLAEFVDAFCDRGAFSLYQSEQVFDAARKHGLGVRAHVCQLTPSNLGPLTKYQPASFDHMDCFIDEDIPQLAKSDTVATLLPGANYFLGLKEYPNARKLIGAGVAVALATDYNPGTSPTTSMPFVLSLACTQMKMSPAEAISAATNNGAHALRLGERKGSIEAGKDADLALFDVKDYREIPYWFGSNHCEAVVMNGNLSLNPSWKKQ
jgi:imidazolonepropionase